MPYPSSVQQFPITPHLDAICAALKKSPGKCAVLTAETGAGKSTVLPLGLLHHFSGRILMTEPRRIAALGVANRVSSLLGESCGGTCGYRMHLENCTGSTTRFEVVTEAVLIREMQNDFSLEKYSVVVIDEFHERSIHTDMALAFLKEALELRDDLFVLVMSATIETEKIASYLGTLCGNGAADVPVIRVPGQTFPVKIEYRPGSSVEAAVLDELSLIRRGTILAFLPGIGDIQKCARNLESRIDRAVTELHMLHSSVPLEAQKAVLSEPEKPCRVIISSAVAETSLTVPGVTCVIDSGLSRVSRMNISTGMPNLVTETESEFSAVQRAGRAGRTAAGKCVRLWNKSDPRIKTLPPEMQRGDICSLVLECAARGIYTVQSADFLDSPGDAAWSEAVFLLKQIGCLDETGHLTKKGGCALELGMHPRLASIMLSASAAGCVEDAEPLFIKYGNYADSPAAVQRKAVADLARRLKKCAFSEESGATEKSMLILNGFADRLAKRISPAGAAKPEYQFPSGRKAVLHSSLKTSPEYIVAPEVMAGTTEAVIFSFEPAGGAHFEKWLSAHSTEKTDCCLENGKPAKFKTVCYGEIVLSRSRLAAGKADFTAAWLGEIRRKGFSCLPTDAKIQSFLLRVQFFRQQTQNSSGRQNGKTDRTLEEELSDSAESWLSPFLGGAAKLDAKTIYDALYWYLNGTEIDSAVPEKIKLQNGRTCKVVYEKNSTIRPVIEVIIQRIFGCFETPQIMNQKVLLKLLSPAGRPLQITDDLAHFWSGTWQEICREMKGRYPKHNWNYKIADDSSPTD